MIQSDTKNKRILLVEDEPIIGRVCTRILMAEGFEVDVANNGLIAKEAAANKNYDLCVSDIRLPEISGIKLHELLKVNQPQLACRMIFITGDTFNPEIKTFLKESGRPCIMKPFTPEELVMKVKESLG